MVDTVIFYTKKAVNGLKIFCYFLDKSVRFDKKKVKKNGRAHFSCIVWDCKGKLL